ncbi:dihydrofolate reductase family protein [Prauserella muralis]|uniref:Uncharacterized protein n=1 Tax=Prauserella muralis TaxID=588067 RepID=A0A2V4B0Z5_9PSEU|nr:dihydrofolate reductase family protein [Prauserella muralis]PXY27703.1 hypothetical protein BAY60_15035 [Prauserella muralis]TWE22553.1 dihydrofolate reductase [Prauserella muralis]
MGKLVVSEFMALNGVIEAPENWSLDYFGGDIADFKLAELRGSEALLLGRTTYDAFAAAWPGRTDETGFADRINTMPKYVVSSSDDAPWHNTTVIDADVAGQVAKLKERVPGDIMINGSGRLVNGLLAKGLIDELTLIVYPVVPPSGQKLFEDGSHAKLDHIESRAFGSGPVLMRYQVRSAVE